jgi:hypothetical protein
MSGWDSEKGWYELTPTKANYYLRRRVEGCPEDVSVVTFLLRQAGLTVMERIYTPAKNRDGGGNIARVMPPDRSYPERICSWCVYGTVAQIWVALSGRDSGPESFRHEGKEELLAAGRYVPVRSPSGQVV